ncbi:dehydrogenase [Burkholderia contaminans FFH2055]|uniref:SDR family oxidoreductase n=1 Tax=Burkholderia contaminans TaxID=488447 RepID=UPI000625F9DE|nr:SDR family oxidoreductase [Burkholderia contaminans]KKL34306.1 dehydrogenase [Burkholderia contaminans FFH2055]MEB4634671.1 SDR family oxidoreductase [Burkholderia contaminans]MEB4641764.1 SDR family oxidoreductase [Burkholderia contaminans]MEB4656759.1 SDR family oxidoreductase [Burkholderia contaminans]MEB4664795.1 SDR family oxidoreductase [Burkholderia contaminans]
MKTVLITGCSSGFGLEVARYFLARDWRVVATMRTPREDVLPPSANLRVLALDVTNPDSIRAAIEAAGPIDVLVNNAGFGAAAPAELMPLDTVRALFETNTFGTIAVTQAVLPQLRQRGAGVVVNVTSSVTLKVLPLLAAYRASKAAVNAYTESVALELAPFGVRAHLVLPGRAPDTRFADNARAHMHGFEHEAYAEFAAAVFARIVDEAAPITHAQDVAEAVWRAATDPSSPMRIPAGADAVAWAAEAG